MSTVHCDPFEAVQIFKDIVRCLAGQDTLLSSDFAEMPPFLLLRKRSVPSACTGVFGVLQPSPSTSRSSFLLLCATVRS